MLSGRVPLAKLRRCRQCRCTVVMLGLGPDTDTEAIREHFSQTSPVVRQVMPLCPLAARS